MPPDNGTSLMADVLKRREMGLAQGTADFGGILAPRPEERQRLQERQMAEQPAGDDERNYAAALIKDLHELGAGGELKAEQVLPILTKGGYQALVGLHKELTGNKLALMQLKGAYGKTEPPKTPFDLQAATDAAMAESAKTARTIAGTGAKAGAVQQPPELRVATMMNILTRDVLPNMGQPNLKVAYSPDHEEAAHFANHFKDFAARNDTKGALDFARQAASGTVQTKTGPVKVSPLTQQIANEILKASTTPATSYSLWHPFTPAQPAKTDVPAGLR